MLSDNNSVQIDQGSIGKIFRLEIFQSEKIIGRSRDRTVIEYLKVEGEDLKTKALKVTFHGQGGKSFGYLLSRDLPLFPGKEGYLTAYNDPTCAILGGSGILCMFDKILSIEDITERLPEHPDCRLRTFESSDDANIGVDSAGHIYKLWVMPDHEYQKELYLSIFGKQGDRLLCALQDAECFYEGCLLLSDIAKWKTQYQCYLRVYETIGSDPDKDAPIYFFYGRVLEMEDISGFLEICHQCRLKL